ncbi:MAG TPA: hypothetical protein VGB70_00360 [Allosphingosinicella sp.]|jgi:hypothetical protein
MANVAPPRFLRSSGTNGRADDIAPALHEAFGARQDRFPQWLEQLLAKLRLR